MSDKLTVPDVLPLVRVYVAKATPAADFRTANIASGYKRTPKGYTWHHHQDKGVMELVPTDLHQAVRHTEGNAKW
jgi:hypothetical protein